MQGGRAIPTQACPTLAAPAAAAVFQSFGQTEIHQQCHHPAPALRPPAAVIARPAGWERGAACQGVQPGGVRRAILPHHPRAADHVRHRARALLEDGRHLHGAEAAGAAGQVGVHQPDNAPEGGGDGGPMRAMGRRHAAQQWQPRSTEPPPGEGWAGLTWPGARARNRGRCLPGAPCMQEAGGPQHPGGDTGAALAGSPLGGWVGWWADRCSMPSCAGGGPWSWRT
jgi:hypothetical protein